MVVSIIYWIGVYILYQIGFVESYYFLFWFFIGFIVVGTFASDMDPTLDEVAISIFKSWSKANEDAKRRNKNEIAKREAQKQNEVSYYEKLVEEVRAIIYFKIINPRKNLSYYSGPTHFKHGEIIYKTLASVKTLPDELNALMREINNVKAYADSKGFGDITRVKKMVEELKVFLRKFQEITKKSLPALEEFNNLNNQKVKAEKLQAQKEADEAASRKAEKETEKQAAIQKTKQMEIERERIKTEEEKKRQAEKLETTRREKVAENKLLKEQVKAEEAKQKRCVFH